MQRFRKVLLSPSLLAAVATGLVVAGVAVAAIPSHGVITGCFQKKSGVLRVIDAAKHGAAGKCKRSETKIVWSQSGPTGPQGVQGPAGAQGTQGAPGVQGIPGANFTVATTLQSGQTESGTYSVSGAVASGEIEDAINFRIPLATVTTHVEFVFGNPSTQCPDPGQAAPGYLCIYGYAGSAGFVRVSDLFSGAAGQASATGFLMEFDASSAGQYSLGTWAVTAP